MRVHLYEKMWMIGAAALVVVFVGAVVLTSYAMRLHPPSHVEMIDPQNIGASPRFHRGTRTLPNGGTEVTLLAMMWSFEPSEFHVPAGKPVTFRITSPDVIHGFEIVGTNVNTMVVPGYVSQLTTTFPNPGEYLIVCHEYCGVGHHTMAAKLFVEGGRR